MECEEFAEVERSVRDISWLFYNILSERIKIFQFSFSIFLQMCHHLLSELDFYKFSGKLSVEHGFKLFFFFF